MACSGICRWYFGVLFLPGRAVRSGVPGGVLAGIRSAALAVAFWCVLAATAAPAVRAGAANLIRGCVEKFDAAVDYFSQKAAIEDAATFTVEYPKVLQVRHGQGELPRRAAGTVRARAVRHAAPKLAGDLAGAQVITVPIPSLFVLSTTRLALLVDLDRVDVLTGVASRDAVIGPELETWIKTAKLVEFAKAGLVIDVERVVARLVGEAGRNLRARRRRDHRPGNPLDALGDGDARRRVARHRRAADADVVQESARRSVRARHHVRCESGCRARRARRRLWTGDRVLNRVRWSLMLTSRDGALNHDVPGSGADFASLAAFLRGRRALV